MSNMAHSERKELRELIPLLIALEQPVTAKEAEQMRQDWLAAGYEAVVEAWTYCHGKLREEQAA